MEPSVAALRVLREIAERGSFTSAAGALGYTQSAVSRQIAGLETQARTRLFDRRPGGVQLTAAGRVLLRHAAVVLDELDAAARELDGRPAEGGLVRLGAFTSAAAVLVPRALAELRRSRPDIEVTTREGSTPVLVRALRAGTLDLVVVASAPPFRAPDTETPALKLETLSERSLLVAVPAASPLAGESIPVEDLRGQSWIASPSTGDETLMGAWPGLDGRPRITHTARDWLSKLQLVAAGCGITTVPPLLAPVMPPGVRLVRVEGGPRERRRVVLARLPGRPAGAVAQVRQALRTVAVELGVTHGASRLTERRRPTDRTTPTGVGGTAYAGRGAKRSAARRTAPMTTSSPTSRTAILTVDDDPAVSRAVARDLRRRYGDTHRIVRADSGRQALDALREMKLRGDLVAVLLADYRMPQMTGIEFLEQAMDLYPQARRVLLTAYADTGAAIDAINVVDLDHYLLKPWDPPEEKLYPVVDQMLESWSAEDHRPVPETKVVGHRWSARSAEVREFLARNQVPYRWYLSDTPEGERLLLAADADAHALPLVITAEGDPLIAPSDAELASRVGLATSPCNDFYDLIVIGGGPAGLGAAVYGASEGLRTVLVERTATGGQAGQSSRIENYLGFPDGVSGAQLTERARRQAIRFGAELITTRDVVALEENGPARTVRFADGASLDAHTVVLATGVSYRQLAAPGLEQLTGRGVFYGSALTQAMNCADEDVYIVGGANSAGQAAVYLARGAKSVTILVRGRSLADSMSYYLVQQIAGIENIRIRPCTEVIKAHGDGHLERLVLRDNATGRTESVDAGWLFVFIGAAPRTDWLDGTVVRDTNGFVLAGPDLVVEGCTPATWTLERPPYHLESSLPGVFVAGDVRSESAKRVASAVGEGAMAVMLVHRYLEKL